MQSIKARIHDELIEAFIRYQYLLDHPMPSTHDTWEIMIQRYRHDPIFNARVDSLASGVMCIIDKYITEESDGK